jgi:hydrogenase maturation protease
MQRNTLVLGWGNPGRGDDGLGPAFVRAVDDLDLPGISVDSDYQLQVEDAAEVARFGRVLFVDADRGGAEPFWLSRLWPDERSLSFSTHSVAPAAVLALTRDLFRVQPEAWIMGIRGYEFDEFREGLSDRAWFNLDQAVNYLKSAVEGNGLHELMPKAARKPIMDDREGELCQTTNP